MPEHHFKLSQIPLQFLRLFTRKFSQIYRHHTQIALAFEYGLIMHRSLFTLGSEVVWSFVVVGLRGQRPLAVSQHPRIFKTCYPPFSISWWLGSLSFLLSLFFLLLSTQQAIEPFGWNDWAGDLLLRLSDLVTARFVLFSYVFWGLKGRLFCISRFKFRSWLIGIKKILFFVLKM